MILRVRFGKEGSLRFIGHLDVLRTFQKIFRRAGIPMLYSQGYNPHPIMSFALPLGLGLTSEGEYLDAGVEDTAELSGMLEKLRKASSEELPVYSIRLLPENAENAMSTVGRALYRLELPETVSRERLHKAVHTFLEKESVVILKKTKTKEAETDIRPLVYHMSLEEDGLYMTLAQGSVANLKPELVLETMAAEGAFVCDPSSLRIRRLDLCDREGVSLGAIGEVVGLE